MPLLGSLLALTSCTTNPATGNQSFTAFMSREDEIRIGSQEHPKLIKEFGGIYKDAKLQSYVKRIGLRLAKYADNSGLNYTFTILNSEKVNALALPGGYIYITRGLLALVENEAEMAGVLAHEIGHVTARHSAERYSTAQATNLGMMVLGVLSSATGVPTGFNRLIGFGAEAALKSYSRDQELESDMLGVNYLVRAGYSPFAMTSFFHKLKSHERLELKIKGMSNSIPNNIFSTHPRTAERINKAIKLAKAVTVVSPILKREEFLREVDGIVFGDDPKQGIRKGREFIHGDLRIRFKAPPNFVLFNSKTQVIARGPYDSIIKFDIAREKFDPKISSLESYMINTWARNLSLKRIEKININGLNAVTASAQYRKKDYRLIAIQGRENLIYRLNFITASSKTKQFNSDFRRTTFSFRQISKSEIENIKPLRIKIIKFSTGDTLLKIAKKMPFETLQLERLRVINGLVPDQKLLPGRRLKVVVDGGSMM
jgi:predicted Zn-dependent protease